MNDVSIYKGDSVNLGFCNTRTEVARENKKPVTAGGVTSGVLRYPHLIQELIEIKKNEKEKLDTNVLILGPGLATVGGVSSPHLHEILAAFSPKAQVTVVDIDDTLISEIGNSVFGFNQRYIAESVLTAYDGHSVSNFSQEIINNIREYVKEIPEKVTQVLEIQKSDFAEFNRPGKYNYIFATQSLMYTFLNFKSLDVQEERKNSLLVISKYLGRLTEGGTLVVDEILYQLMKKHLTVLPHTIDLEKAEVRWDYKTKNLTTPFTARRIEVPNNSRGVGNTPNIYYKDQQNQSRHVSTADIYLITRLVTRTQPTEKSM